VLIFCDISRFLHLSRLAWNCLFTPILGKFWGIWRGSPWNWVRAQGVKKTTVLGLPDGRKSFKIDLAVLTQYWRVTDTEPPSQPSFHSKYRASKRRAGKNYGHALYRFRNKRQYWWRKQFFEPPPIFLASVNDVTIGHVCKVVSAQKTRMTGEQTGEKVRWQCAAVYRRNTNGWRPDGQRDKRIYRSYL